MILEVCFLVSWSGDKFQSEFYHKRQEEKKTLDLGTALPWPLPLAFLGLQLIQARRELVLLLTQFVAKFGNVIRQSTMNRGRRADAAITGRTANRRGHVF